LPDIDHNFILVSSNEVIMTKSSNNNQQNSGAQQSSAKPERAVKVSGPKLVGGALDGGSKEWFASLTSNKK
jgi:hypothetical protein